MTILSLSLWGEEEDDEVKLKKGLLTLKLLAFPGLGLMCSDAAFTEGKGETRNTRKNTRGWSSCLAWNKITSPLGVARVPSLSLDVEERALKAKKNEETFPQTKLSNDFVKV